MIMAITIVLIIIMMIIISATIGEWEENLKL